MAFAPFLIPERGNVYLDKDVPVLDYEVVILEYPARFEIFLFRTYTDGKEYEKLFNESHKHVSGFNPF